MLNTHVVFVYRYLQKHVVRARDLEILFQRGRFPPSGFVFQEFCKNVRKVLEINVHALPGPPKPSGDLPWVVQEKSSQSNGLEQIQNRSAILIFPRDFFN